MPAREPVRLIVELECWTHKGRGGAPFRQGVVQHIRSAEIEVPAGAGLATITVRIAGRLEPIALIDFRPPTVEESNGEDPRA